MNIIRVKAFPDSKKAYIEQVSDKALRVFVRDSAQNNAANRAIVRAVAEFYTITENKLRIIAGHQSHNKTIRVLE